MQQVSGDLCSVQRVNGVRETKRTVRYFTEARRVSQIRMKPRARPRTEDLRAFVERRGDSRGIHLSSPSCAHAFAFACTQNNRA